MTTPRYTKEEIAVAFQRNGGNISATARELGIVRQTVQYHLRGGPLAVKPLTGGTRQGRKTLQGGLPPKGIIKRYICTSAQNNTKVEPKFWENLLVLADYYDAEILVGTFSYNQNSFGKLAVKKGTKKKYQSELWYDPVLEDYISDDRIQLANGLVWCGEMNILPTAVDPLSGLETYSHRESAIFPHVKLAMRSIPTMLGEGAKLNFTTGTVTQKNYIQKKEGIKAEHHHRYAALVVEVNHQGNWWVRQIGMGSKSDTLQDLDIAVVNGKIEKGQTVEAITWGDLHATMAEEWVIDQSVQMLDTLRPKFQFIHDVLEGASISCHLVGKPSPHKRFHTWLRGLHRFEHELQRTVAVLERYHRPWCQTLIPDSNHDSWWLHSWLENFDFRYDPGNAEIFLKLNTFMYEKIRENGLMPKDVPITQYALSLGGLKAPFRVLLPDESFKICGNKIECGQHGHLGPNGARGTPESLNKIGRRANTAHTHSAGIWNGLYVAGTSSKMKWTYNYGPSSWSNSHIVTYPNGQRAIVTMYAGRWRA